jgi:hypothetical protein
LNTPFLIIERFMMSDKHNSLKWGTIPLVAMVMAACGSGGSGSGATAATTSTTSTSTTSTTTSTTPNSFQGVVRSTGVASGVGTVNAGKYTYTFDGHAIDVTSPSVTAGYTVNLTSNGINTVIGGTTYAYSRFGAVGYSDALKNGDVFYMGTPTVTMPTTGTARYVGALIQYNYGNPFTPTGDMTNAGLTARNANFNVDFGAKTLTGTSDYTSGDMMSLLSFQNGTIQGSAFSGQLVNNGMSGSFSGSFFGPNAEELGGVGKLGSGESLPFGAKRQ